MTHPSPDSGAPSPDSAAPTPDSGAESVEASYERLKAFFQPLGRVVVAFSGGVDSSLLLAAAYDVLGEGALAVTARSPAHPPQELDQALALARTLGARHALMDSQEMLNAEYRSNPPHRCYVCKRALLSDMRAIADREGASALVDGSNADDVLDFRPGMQAARELGVRSPLAELGFGKQRIRLMARARGLSNWAQPSCACLATRIPYGQEISPERLKRLAEAEAGLHALGFRVVRVRDYGELARIELGEAELLRAVEAELRPRIVHVCHQAGYVYVCVDLQGYRSGSMNALLKPQEKQSP